MKKIILLILLLGIIYFIGTNVLSTIDSASQKASSTQTGTSQPVEITLINKRQSISTKNNFIYLIGDFTVKSNQSGNQTYIAPPKILKDGVDFVAPTSSAQFSGWKLKRIHVIGYTALKSSTFSTSTFSPARGTSYYRFGWAIDKRSLPEGNYQFSFTNYSTRTSTTSTSSTNLVPLNTPWTKSIKVSQTGAVAPDRLNNAYYKLVSYEGVPYTGSSAPIVFFANGQIKAKICQIEHIGNYQLVRNLIVSNSLPKQAYCSDPNLLPMERNFLFQIPFGLESTFNGELMTLKGRAGGNIIEYVFTRYYPQTPTRIYPCDFVGPLEVGAVRDCSGNINQLVGGTNQLIIPGSNLPTLTNISTTSARFGTQVTLTGTGFATSNLVMFTPTTNLLTTPKPVARVATSSANSASFIIPTVYLCESLADGSVCDAIPLPPGTYSVQMKTPSGISTNSFILNIH